MDEMRWSWLECVGSTFTLLRHIGEHADRDLLKIFSPKCGFSQISI